VIADNAIAVSGAARRQGASNDGMLIVVTRTAPRDGSTIGIASDVTGNGFGKYA
jgi:hypothetical protein